MLSDLDDADLDTLAEEVREHLVRTVTATGGHLGPNLGVVELTIALHRVFDSPRDRIVFDTGHQSYVHKLLTGRQDFSMLRRQGGLSGYPSRAESEHDVVENSHASTALSWADGIARAFQVQGVRDRHAVAVVGDGALTGGMSWEALNNIAHDPERPVIVVVNDNGRSYSPTIGGLAAHLEGIRTDRRYERVLTWGRHSLTRRGRIGRWLFDALHATKAAVKDYMAPQGMFTDLGIKYVGPVDGHDRAAVERALRRARRYGGPVLVHVITQKGRGYALAEAHDDDQFHAVGVIDPVTGAALSPSAPSWTAAFADEMVHVGRERPDVVGITAAMLIPVGLKPFADAHPDRIVDVGIAEQHGATSAAGHGAGRAAPGHGRVRDVPQPRLRPGPHGRGPAPGRRHVRPGPGRGHRRRRRQPQRHVGHVDPAGGPRAAPGRPARRGHPAHRAARGPRRRPRPHGRALPQGRAARRRARGGPPRRRRRPPSAAHRRPRRARRRRRAPWRAPAWTPPSGSRRTAWTAPSSTPAG